MSKEFLSPKICFLEPYLATNEEAGDAGGGGDDDFALMRVPLTE